MKACSATKVLCSVSQTEKLSVRDQRTESGSLGGSECRRALGTWEAPRHTGSRPSAGCSLRRPNKVIEIDAVAKEVGRRAGLLRK